MFSSFLCCAFLSPACAGSSDAVETMILFSSFLCWPKETKQRKGLFCLFCMYFCYAKPARKLGQKWLRHFRVPFQVFLAYTEEKAFPSFMKSQWHHFLFVAVQGGAVPEAVREAGKVCSILLSENYSCRYRTAQTARP